MRTKRSKQYKKLMKQYALSFNFREPYQVLLDSQLIIDAARFKMHLGKMLESTLLGTIKPMITQCCMRHLYNLPASSDAEKRQKESYIEVAKAAERRRCDHHDLEDPLSTLECLQSVVDPKSSGTNRHRYVVASQDLEVRASMREIAGVPLVYINRSVMILEPMASKTAEVRQQEEKGKIRAGLKTRRGADVGEKRKREKQDDGSDQDNAGVQDGAAVAPAPKKRKVKGPKEPNSLSMKKSKKDKQSGSGQRKDADNAIKKATVNDPQAPAKALDQDSIADGQHADGVVEGARKRKRKRKPKEGVQHVISAAR